MAIDYSGRLEPRASGRRIDRRSMPTLAEVLARETREGDLYDVAAGRPPAVLRVRPLLSAPRRRGRRLQGALQRGRPPARAVGLRRRRAVRSDREEAVLPRVSRARSPTASACSAAICTAATARTGSRRRRCAIRPRSRRRCAPRPSDLVRDALRQGARVMVSTYNEPLITSEWAVAVFKEAKAAGLVTGFVSNGNGTPQVLEYLRPWVDLYKVDLKSFDDRHYRELGGRLAPILDTIRRLHAMGVLGRDRHAADSRASTTRATSCTRLTAFIAGVSPDIPWHVTAFHGDYKMTGAREHDRRHAARGRRHRPRERAALRLRRQPAGPGRRPRGHALRRRAASCSSSRCGYHIRELPAHRRTAAARPAPRRCPGAGAPASRARSRRGPFGLEFTNSEFRILNS